MKQEFTPRTRHLSFPALFGRALFTGIVLLFSIYSFAATVTWDDEAGDFEWTTATNWVGDVLPGPNDDVVLANGDFVNLSTGTYTIKSLKIEDDHTYLKIDTGAELIVENATGFGVELTATTTSNFYDDDLLIKGNLTIINSGDDGLRIGVQRSVFVEGPGSPTITITDAGGDGVHILGLEFGGEADLGSSASGIININSPAGNGINVQDPGAEFSGSGTVNIDNAGENGIYCHDTGTGFAELDLRAAITITDPVEDGIRAYSKLDIGGNNILTINNAGDDGIELFGNELQRILNGTVNINNAGTYGLHIRGDFIIENNATVNISNAGSHGIYVENNQTIDIEGLLSITGSTGDGIHSKGTVELTGEMGHGTPNTIISNSGGNGFENLSGDNLIIDAENTLTISGSTGTDMEIGGSITLNGILEGVGDFNAGGNTLDGTVSPGTSPGTMNFSGDQTFSGSNTLAIEIDGTTPNTQHDVVTVAGTATLSGTIGDCELYTR